MRSQSTRRHEASAGCSRAERPVSVAATRSPSLDSTRVTPSRTTASSYTPSTSQPGVMGGALPCGPGRAGRRGEGKADSEAAALPFLALHVDGPGVALDDAPRHRQAQAGAARALRGE